MKNINLKLLVEIIIISISLFCVVDANYKSWETNKAAIEETQLAIDKETELSVEDINKRLLYVMNTGQEFADAITSGKIQYSDLEDYTKNIMISNHDIHVTHPSKFYNLGVSFLRGAYDKSKPEQLANWIYIADKETGEITSINRDYDYSKKDGTLKTDWFTKAVEERKAFWQQPKYGDVSNHFLIAYSVPFYTSSTKEQVAGVISIGFSTDELKEIMSHQSYRKVGFAVIASDEGKLVYHPNELLPQLDISNNHSFFNEAFDFLNKVDIKDKATKTIQSFELPGTNEEAWVITKTIPAANWSYHVFFQQNELGVEQKTLATKLYLTISTIIFIVTCAYIFLISSKNKTKRFWLFCIFLGINFTVGTAYLWKIADIKELELTSNTIKLNSDEEVNAYKNTQAEFFSVLHKQPPIYIPTGVFIKSTEFLGSNNIVVAGYVWQKYNIPSSLKPNTVPDDFCSMTSEMLPENKDVLLADAFADNENNSLTCDKSSYRVAKNHVVTVGWYFKAELREPFDYSNFPLDNNTIWLRLRPDNQVGNVVLVPDFSSYTNINEKSLMGIDISGLVLPSWEVFGTFFSSEAVSLNSNFGVTDVSQQVSQELLFNIAIKRAFLDSVFSTVIPIFLIYLILFVVLFSSLDDLLSVLGINAGLLFSVALWHSTLRTSLSSTGVTYFETYYFVCYFVISLICINSVLLSCRYELPWLHYKNNLIPKLIFIPMVTGVTFLITIFMLF